jgi:hypothetical protein
MAIKDAKSRRLDLTSDESVSDSAIAVYKKLEKKGYKVNFNKEVYTETVADGTVHTISSNTGEPVVTVYTNGVLPSRDVKKASKADKVTGGVLGDTPEAPKKNPLAMDREPMAMGMEQLSNDDVALVGGMRSGSSQGDETRLKYTVYDMKAITKNDDMANADKYELGDVELFVEDGTGKVRGLVQINIKDKKKGSGKKIIDSLMASDFVNDDFKIHDIKKKALPFWKKMGVEFENPKGEANLKRKGGGPSESGFIRKGKAKAESKSKAAKKAHQDYLNSLTK